MTDMPVTLDIPVMNALQNRYVTASVTEWTALLESRVVSNQAKVLMAWLTLQAAPRTGAVEPTSVASVAASLSWSSRTVTRAIAELVDAGMVDAHLPRGHHQGGRLAVIGYYDVMQPTKWLSRQRAIGGTP